MKKYLLAVALTLLTFSVHAQWPGYTYRPSSSGSSGVGVFLPLAGGTMAGHLLFSPDNTYDIGASGATRPRNVYVANAITAGNNITAGSAFLAGSTGYLAFGSRGAMSAASNGVWGLYDDAGTSFGRLMLGGTTSSYPAIKRSAATIAFRLADDSADAGISAGAGTFGGEVITASTIKMNGDGANRQALYAGGSNSLTIGADFATVGVTSPLTLTETVGASALTLTGATQTASFPVLNATQTWNNAAVTFTGLKVNVTSTASAAASLVMDLQVGGASQFKVRKDGYATFNSGAYFGDNITSIGTLLAISNDTGKLVFGVTNDLILSRPAAAILQQGAANAASPVAQVLQSQGSRGGTDSNVGGGNYTVRSGTGTGTGTLSSLILQSPIAVASGSGAQTNTTGLTIHNGTAVLTAYTVATLPAAPSTGAMAYVTDATAPTYLGALTGGGAVVTPVFYNGAAWVSH